MLALNAYFKNPDQTVTANFEEKKNLDFQLQPFNK